jgi:hypothetical protein
MEIHTPLTETLGENAPSYVYIKNWVAQFKRGDFTHVMNIFIAFLNKAAVTGTHRR